MTGMELKFYKGFDPYLLWLKKCKANDSKKGQMDFLPFCCTKTSHLYVLIVTWVKNPCNWSSIVCAFWSHLTDFCFLFSVTITAIEIILATNPSVKRPIKQLFSHIFLGQGDQKNIVGANNHYDVEYMRYFTGFDPEYLPNLAAFTQTKYQHSKSDFLIAHIRDTDFRSWFVEAVQRALGQAKSKEKVVYVGDVYPTGYNATDLASHPGIILVPELVSIMKYIWQNDVI